MSNAEQDMDAELSKALADELLESITQLSEEALFKRSLAIGLAMRHPERSAEFCWAHADAVWAAKPKGC